MMNFALILAAISLVGIGIAIGFGLCVDRKDDSDDHPIGI